MSLEEADKVDLIGISRETGAIELAIVDDFDWINSDAHLNLLQNKIYAYMDFVENGGIYEIYPSVKSFSLIIVILAKYQPCKKGIDFFEKVRELLNSSGYEFQFKHVTD